MAKFGVYMIGVLLVAGGLAFGAQRLGLSEPWIWIVIVVILGFGVMGGIVKTRSGSP